MKTTETIKIEWTERILLGKVDGENIYLSAPSWDFDWYWGFGYLGNKNCHYHVDGMYNKKNISIYDAFKKHFDDGTLIVSDNDLWTLCELFKSFYTLREAAELYKNGCAGQTTNPCASAIQNNKERNRINEEVLPFIFNEIHRILTKNN